MPIQKKEFFEAAGKGDLPVINTYLAENRNNPDAINVQDHYGYTAVHLAVWAKKKDCLKTLIEAGANVNITRNSENKTPLHLAAEKSWLEGTKLLLDAKADVNQISLIGKTACHLAASKADNQKLLKMLIEAGANLSIRDYEGKSPITTAMCNGFPQSVTLLLHEGAVIEEEDKRIFHYNYRKLREKADVPFNSMEYHEAFGFSDSEMILDNFKKVEALFSQGNDFQNATTTSEPWALIDKNLQSKLGILLKSLGRLEKQIETLTLKVDNLEKLVAPHPNKSTCFPGLFKR